MEKYTLVIPCKPMVAEYLRSNMDLKAVHKQNDHVVKFLRCLLFSEPKCRHRHWERNTMEAEIVKLHININGRKGNAYRMLTQQQTIAFNTYMTQFIKETIARIACTYVQFDNSYKRAVEHAVRSVGVAETANTESIIREINRKFRRIKDNSLA